MQKLNLEKVNYIVVHCTASKPNADIGVKEIRVQHQLQGWEDCGYHFVVRKDGQLEQGRKFFTVGAHCKGYNNTSIGVCYVGGLDENGDPKDTRTEEQKEALQYLIDWLSFMFPRAQVVGHHDLNPAKSCPCFDARSEYGR